MERKYLVAGVVFSLTSVASLIKAFKSRKKQVPDTKNIEKNRQMNEKIKSLKEDIKVEQKIKNEK